MAPAHPNQAASYVAGLETELEMAKAGGNKAHVADVAASLKEARLVSTTPLPLSVHERDHQDERDYQTQLDKDHIGRPPPATAQEKAQAYLAALQVDLEAKKGTASESHVKAELARAKAALAAVKEDA